MTNGNLHLPGSLWMCLRKQFSQIKINIVSPSTLAVSDFQKLSFSEEIYQCLWEYVATHINLIICPYNSTETVLMCRGLGGAREHLLIQTNDKRLIQNQRFPFSSSYVILICLIFLTSIKCTGRDYCPNLLQSIWKTRHLTEQ